MKVLKAAPPRRPYMVEALCTGAGNDWNGCHARLLVEEDDMRFFPGREGAVNIVGPAVSFRCCSCSAVTDLPQSDWPRVVPGPLRPWSKKWAAEGVDE